MHFIKRKPMSVNEAWQGRRFRTPTYKQFRKDVTPLLHASRVSSVPKDKPLFVHYVFGVSNMGADIDNPCKPITDILFDFLGVNDNRIEKMFIEKVKTDKGKEFIGFHVDTTDDLIEYLEKLLAGLKKEKNREE